MSEGIEDIYCYTLKISFSSDRAQNFFAHVLDPQEQESTMKILSVCPCVRVQKQTEKDFSRPKLWTDLLQILHVHLLQCILQYNIKNLGFQSKLHPPGGLISFCGSLKFQKKNVCGSKLWTDMLQILHVYSFQCILYDNVYRLGTWIKLPPPQGDFKFLD